MRGYYFITDKNLSRRGNISDIKSALACKVEFIQYRNKSGSSREFYQEALYLRRLCAKVKFIVNDRIDIALAIEADGVHLGQLDMPYKAARRLLGEKRIIGLSVHSLKEAIEAQGLGVDYISVGPVFSTTTKRDTHKPLGPGLLKKIRQRVSCPVVAIGGINLSNAEEVIKTGVDGICAISAVVASPDVKAQIKKFQDLFRKFKRG